ADVVLAATDRPIGVRQASQLRSFVRHGGGLVLLGGTLAAWSSPPPVRELAGWVPSGPGPVTELVLRPEAGPEWRVRDRLYLSEGPPAEARVLLRTSWRYTEQTVAYERRFGDGRFVYLGLSTYEDPNFRRLLARLLVGGAGGAGGGPGGGG